MVVLEGGGMLSSGSNQYLQPDYLSPLPTTLDAKKSPLALLAQTCSQIGADSPNSKPLIPPLEKPKKSAAPADSSPAPDKADSKPARSSPPEPRLAFKPYETNVVSRKEDSRPPSKSGSVHGNDEDRKSNSRAPSRKSASPACTAVTTPVPGDGKSAAPASSGSTNDRGKSVSPRQNSGTEGASPIIRSGLEILNGHPKDLPLGTYKSGTTPLSAGLTGLGGSSLSSLCSGCPPGLEPTNPAFRPPFAGGPFSHHHAAMLAAGYPSAAPGPYVSYARVKTAGGGEALVPVCKDPYCTGCQYSAAHQQLLLSGACPSGCTQCDHQKYGLALSGLMPPGPVPPPPPLSYSHQLGRPYVCNWIAGDSYCGKRFANSDELLQHLRTHTSLATAADNAAAAAANSAASMSLLNPHSFLSSSAALHRAAAGYPNPPLSPLSAARYHPYSKPGLPGSLGASPFSAFNPTALGPYYSPYSLYGQRIGAAVHP
ncbi:zinc finger protein Noc [Anabrus simplex]|uniref:zinc finger protein Noc n=1 Tax=Anabrus simplex TaxID=316456 RepID=UPI0035A2AD11